MKKIVMAALCASLMGCAGTSLSGFEKCPVCSGTPFSWTDVQKIKSGMTRQQVADILGAPYSTAVEGNRVTETWVEVNGLTMKSKTAAVIFYNGRVSKAPTPPVGTH